MAIEVWKLTVEGYLIRDTDNMGDPNLIDFDVVVDAVLRNPFESSLTKIDTLNEGDKIQIGNTIYLVEGAEDGKRT